MPQDAPPNTINHSKELPGAPMTSVLGFDHACIGCEYNLLGISIGGVCPECSMPVESSLKRRLLRHAPAMTLRTLRNGARLVTIAALLPLMLLVVSLISALLIPTALLGVVSAVLLVVIWAMFLLGWHSLTTPLDGFDLVPETDKIRQNCRITTYSFGVCAVVLVLSSVNFGVSGTSLVPFVLMLVLLVLSLVQLRLGTKRVQHIARAIPSKGLVKYSKTVYWVLVSFIVITIGSVVMQIMAFATQFGGAASGGAFVIISVVLGLLSILSFILMIAGYAMYIGLFRRLWIGLSKVEKTQRADQQQVTAEA